MWEHPTGMAAMSDKFRIHKNGNRNGYQDWCRIIKFNSPNKFRNSNSWVYVVPKVGELFDQVDCATVHFGLS